MTSLEAVIVDNELFDECLTGDPEMDLELVKMAVDLLDDMLGLMQNALDQGDNTIWKESAHRARGSCLSLGFAQASGLLQAAEHEIAEDSEKTSMLARLHLASVELRRRLAEMGFAV